ncbi:MULTISPECIES: HAD family hydrolase [Halopenitus]|uniref:Haloacid dehalogenase superfamily, subfamily IA, variant 1 with third motif having Dx(3-4)D or Dx(3-4)E n=1 Tax=Halopenitus malekzadehii TaxID=1267564 RepID=A0A1H6IJX3_9EURY|nr:MULTISPECIES: HAD family hydrolase [Halopenitus]SEH49190.1 haloacid dehalogenase superfamily, subfamily IA, variant 1 with third motif having Dx(3-4)D or Dx(3-4)E [Halopenitus malekzadehii]
MYDAVVFDNDGVLVGRTPFDTLREAAWNAFESVGVEDPDLAHVDDLAIGVTPATLTDVCERYDVDPAEFWRARDRTASDAQIDDARAGRKTPYEDVDVIDDLDASLGIVSSNQQATVEFLLDHFELSERFEAVYGREPSIVSLSRKKPSPYYLERVLEDLDAETALFVGDNESDLEAADNAGIDSAFIRRPHRREFELSRTPTYDIDDLHDLVSICGRR